MFDWFFFAVPSKLATCLTYTVLFSVSIFWEFSFNHFSHRWNIKSGPFRQWLILKVIGDSLAGPLVGEQLSEISRDKMKDLLCHRRSGAFGWHCSWTEENLSDYFASASKAVARWDQGGAKCYEATFWLSIFRYPSSKKFLALTTHYTKCPVT